MIRPAWIERALAAADGSNADSRGELHAGAREARSPAPVADGFAVAEVGDELDGLEGADELLDDLRALADAGLIEPQGGIGSTRVAQRGDDDGC